MGYDRSMFGEVGTHSEVELEIGDTGTVDVIMDVILGQEGDWVAVTPAEPTRLFCGQCGRAYYLGEEVPHESLFHICAHCLLSGKRSAS